MTNPQSKTSRPKCWHLLQARWKCTNEAYFWRTYTWNSLWHFVKRPRYFIWLLLFLPVIGWKKEWLGNLKKKARTRAISFKTVEIAQRQKSMESGSVEAQRSIMIMIIITGLDQLLMYRIQFFRSCVLTFEIIKVSLFFSRTEEFDNSS